MFGAGDQNAAEAFLAVLFFYLYARYLRLYLKKGNALAVMALPPGMVLGLCLLLWQGSVLFAAAASAFAVLILVRQRASGILPFHLLTMFFAALPVAAVRAWIPGTTEQTIFSFGFFSWFQPFFCFLCMIPVLFVYAVISFSGKKNKRILLWILAGAVILAGLAGVYSNILSHMLSGLAYVFRHDPWLSKIAEFQVPFSIRSFFVSPGDRSFQEWMQFFCYALPLFLFALLMIRFRKCRAGEIWMLLLILFFAPLAFQQSRWVVIYSTLISAAFAVLLTFILKRFSSRVVIILGTVVLALPLPALFIRANLSTILETHIQSDMFSGLTWLRRFTPSPGDPLEPSRMPGYGVLAQWDVGHCLIYISRRPCIASPFGSQLRGHGLEDSLEFCMTPEESRAVAICEERKIRYVLMSDFLYALYGLSGIIDPGYAEKFFSPRDYHGLPYYLPGKAFYQQVYPRMYLYDGRGRGNTAPLTRFRLVWESAHQIRRPYFPVPVNIVKIFEFVEGARIQGKAPAGSPVHFRIELLTNKNRRFVYQASAAAGPSGMYSLVVPYSTQDINFRVSSRKPFALLTCDGRERKIRLTEGDVRQGRTLSFDFE